MKKNIKTLGQLQQMRARTVSDLTAKLAQQQQLCHRYQQNIQALTHLKESSHQLTTTGAVQLYNHASYSAVLQKVIDWQQQEQILADQQANTLQQNLLQAARKEKSVEQILIEQKSRLAYHTARKEQKVTDDYQSRRRRGSRKEGY